VSLVPDRRRSRRGGRRVTDYGWTSPPPIVPCTECATGTADLLPSSTEGANTTVTYRCRDCGHQFDRHAE
jgi:hypothetical protein